LEAAARLPISDGENTPLAETVRTCQQLLQREAALWTFVHHPMWSLPITRQSGPYVRQ